MTETPPDAEAAPKIDPQEMVDSVTGFDEMAIIRAFGQPLDSLTGTLTLRALVFLVERRGGMKDIDAYQSVMAPRADVITDRFVVPPEVDDSGKVPTPENEPN
jgi:hypothetical protein